MFTLDSYTGQMDQLFSSFSTAPSHQHWKQRAKLLFAVVLGFAVMYAFSFYNGSQASCCSLSAVVQGALSLLVSFGFFFLT
jgi:hypothetical protein